MPEDVRRERKVVTVLFCDLVGFTSRAEEMDPEDVASLLGPYHARVKQELEHFGGTVEKFIGDAVMALFGAPVAHEDDPERAVRAAFAIRDFADAEGIELRIGITTGEALVTLGARPDRGETMAAGDVVNTAARLQAAAPVGGILVGEKTHEATKDAIEYAEAGPTEVKGKARPIAVWQALSARARIALDRLHGTPFVGRAHELALLEGALTRSREERACQLVTLVGVPGIGKSRLVYELSQAVDRDPELISWRQGRCLPYGDGVTFWALGEIVKAQSGISETDSREETERKLRVVAGDSWVEAHLRPLVGLAGEQELGGDRRGESFVAWRRFLEELAEKRPLVLVFEDLHWADESLLDFVDYLVEWAAAVPLLCVCTARPELLERRPAWGGGKSNALTLSLSPLTDDDTARLVGELLERRLLPAEAQAALLTRASGNPLYAEQFARMLDERLEVEELPLPETVQGIIAARLDALAPEQKSLLQDAAVLGKVFPLGGLVRVTGSDTVELEERLHALERKEFIRRDRQSAGDGEVEFSFRHILVRDVAYGQIPRVERGEKHRRAAGWIESLGRADDYAETLAYHYLEALELAAAAGLDTDPIVAPARSALRSAGDRALALCAYQAASRFYTAALEIWPGDDELEYARVLFNRARAIVTLDPDRPDALVEARDALLAAGDREAAVIAETEISVLLWYQGRRDAAYEHADRALVLAGDAPTVARAHALAMRARNLSVAGESEAAIEVGREALELARVLEQDRLYATALRVIGQARQRVGDEGGMEDLERSLEILTAIPVPEEAQRAFTGITNGYWERGQLAKAAETIAETRAWCDRFPLPVALRWLAGVEVIHSYKTGAWPDAERMATAFLAEREAGSRHYLEAPCRHVRAYVRLARDDPDGADVDSEAALALARDAKDAQALIPALAARTRVLRGLGESGESARPLVDEAMPMLAACPVHWLVDMAWASVAVGRDEPFANQLEMPRVRSPWVEAARYIASGRYGDSADLLGAMGALGEEAYARLRAADVFAAQGRRAEADVQLERALAFFRSVGAARHVREAEALVAAAS